MPRRSPASRSIASWLALALLSYVPTFTSKPGMVAADTKQYLYLDPGRLTRGAASMWDPHQGMGTVTHQNIGYLFPMGPYYWAIHALGIPMWVGQRIWMGTLLFSAGTGVLWCTRHLGLSRLGGFVAAVAYTATPYIIDYIARISAILMPWAAVGWMLGLVVLAARRGGWRYPALFSLVVAVVGGVNATSILLVGLAPAVWLIYAVWVTREVTLRRAWGAVWRISVLSVGVSLWWIAGLWAEGSYGLAILQYTETVKTVARTSLASEALRGLGYWFFYGQDKVQPWTTAAVPYMQALWLLAVSFCVPAVCVLVGLFARWRYRAFAVLLVLVGAVAAVGTYPYSHPSPLGSALKAAATGSTVGLAMRSSNRVMPLLVLGLALLLGSGVAALATVRPRLSWAVGAACIGLVLADMPPFWDGGLVATNLARPSAIPSYWLHAASYLDAQGRSTRVLGIPGEDFAAYRWGVTEDPILPGLMTRPYVARQVVPQGEPNSVDLLEAIDSSIQDNVFDPNSLAPIARLMSAGDVLVQNDLQYERYALPQPRALWAQLDPAPKGTRLAATFGPAQPTPVIKFPLIDETELGLPKGTGYPPSLAVLAVPGARPIYRAESASDPLVVAGSGKGLVYAADAGLLAGNPTVFYSASFDSHPAQLDRLLADGAALVVTDTNAKQAHRWGGLQNNLGYIEQPNEKPLVPHPSNAPLPLFPGSGTSAQTTADLVGIKSVRATGYGNPVTYTPEDRPSNALDGNPSTAWTVAAFSNPVGQRLEIQLQHPVTTNVIGLLQPGNGRLNRYITKVDLSFDHGPALPEKLSKQSRSGNGQAVHFPTRTFSTLDITIEGTNRGGGKRKDYDGLAGVGFAEVGIPGVSMHEVIDMPTDLLDMAGKASQSHELVFLMDRVRAPDVPPRTDPQLNIVRSFALPTTRTFTVGGQARVSAKDSDALIDQVIGAPGPSGVAPGLDPVVADNSSTRLPGDRFARADAAVDGNPNTSWSAALAAQDGEWLEYTLARPLTFDHLDMQVVNDGRHSLPKVITIAAGGSSRTVTLPPIKVGRGRPQGSVTEVPVHFASLTGSQVTITIDTVHQLTTLDYYGGTSGARDILPVALAEVGLPGVAIAPPPARVPAVCHSHLLSVDGKPVDVEITGSTADALAGDPLTVKPCGNSVNGITLGPGRHTVQTAERFPSGWEIDQLWLASAGGGQRLLTPAGGGLPAPPTGPAPQVRVIGQSRTSATLSVAADPGTPAGGYWLVLGQSLSRGWTATIRPSGAGSPARALGAPTLIDGYANGWFVPAVDAARPLTVELNWTPQRVVWMSLALSAVALALCLGLALIPRRRRAVPSTTDPDARWAEPSLGTPMLLGGNRPRAPVLAAVAVLAGLVGAALSSPWAVVLAAPLALALWFPRARPLLGLAAVAAVLATAGFMVDQQVVHGYVPNIKWPGNFGPANTLGWAAILLLAADALAEAVRTRPGGRPGSHDGGLSNEGPGPLSS